MRSAAQARTGVLMFDNVRLQAELNHIHRGLSTVAASAQGKGLVDGLRSAVKGTNGALIQQALLADCMRIVYGALAADGDISDREIAALHDFLLEAARHYAELLGYGVPITSDLRAARIFLERYAAD